MKQSEPQTIASLGAKRILPAPIEVPDPAVILKVQAEPTPEPTPTPEVVHDLPYVHIPDEPVEATHDEETK